MKLSPFVRQLWVTTGVTLNNIGHGCIFGFSTILLTQLRESGSSAKITTSDASWLASIIAFSTVIGNFICPILMERYGRKLAHMVTIFPVLIGWFIILFVDNVMLLIFARFFQGLSIGMMTPLGNVMIGEFCSPANRGMFLISNPFGIAFGTAVTHTIGTFLSWKYTAMISSIFTFISLVFIIISPETPSWLASKKRYEESRKVFLWLRGCEDKKQLEELEVMIGARKAEFKEERGSESITLLTTIRKKEFYKPIWVMFHLYTLFLFSGMSVLTVYTLEILNKLLGVGQNLYLWMLCLDFLRLTTTIFAVFIIKSFKRRLVLYSSGALCIITLLSIAVYSSLKTLKYIKGESPIIPVALIFIYTFTLSLGMSPIPFTIAGEIFPVRYRSYAGGISGLLVSLMSFTALKTAPFMLDSVDLHGTYFIYALISFYCLFVLWVVLPETKGKTLQEIENYFKGVQFDVKDFESIQP